MAQQLRILAALAEDPGLITGTQLSNSSSRGANVFFRILKLEHTHTRGTQTYV